MRVMRKGEGYGPGGWLKFQLGSMANTMSGFEMVSRVEADVLQGSSIFLNFCIEDIRKIMKR